MANRAVINASPLIFLSHGNYINLLQFISLEIVVPEAVAEEILKRGSQDPTAQAIEKITWLKITPTPPVSSIIQAWDLGAGESAVLAWASEHKNAEAIIDDLAARRCAKTLNIPFTGTLGVVLLAKKQGAIPKARPVLDTLRLSGMYLSNAVINSALQLVDE